jgi:hypothetical protein
MISARMTRIPVLTYHSIDNSASVISVTSETFRGQMNFLAENDFNVVSLESLRRQLFDNILFRQKLLL